MQDCVHLDLGFDSFLKTCHILNAKMPVADLIIKL